MKHRKVFMLERKEIWKLHHGEMPRNCVGFDRNGNMILEGDAVEVLPPDTSGIIGNPFNAEEIIGKRGTASRHSCFPTGWVTTITIGTESYGCWDFDLIKVVPTRI